MTGDPPRSAGALAQQARLSPWVILFILSLFLPIDLFVGGIRLSFYRIILLLVIFPALFRFFSLITREGVRAADVLIILFSIVGTLALVMTGASAPALGGFFLEAMGPFFLARAFIRTGAQFIQAMRILVWCIIGLLPFAVYESLTTDPILITILGKAFHVLENVPHEIRLGMDRAQVVFDHPILFGVFGSLGFSVAIYATSTATPPRKSFLKGALVGLCTFFSLSSGAFVSLGVQGVLILYDLLFRKFSRRWIVLFLGMVALLTALELASNRSLAQISIQFIAMNPGTAWTRLQVNDWALATIDANFWFGIGFNPPPPPPSWVPTTSIDNFWLAIAFRHGAPTALLLIGAVAFVLLAVARTRQEDPAVQACRTAFMITMTGICVAITTVHLWNSAYCAFMFFLGAGLWLAERQGGAARADTPPPPEVGYRRNLPASPYRRENRRRRGAG